MTDYLRHMLDLALRKELQGIHFWATVYVLVVLLGSLWHVVRVRAWPTTTGQLLRLGVRPLGTPDLQSHQQDHIPSALYRYEVGGVAYEGQEISVWKYSASGILKGKAALLPRRVRADVHGRVPVLYNPRRHHKSLLLRPGWGSILFLSGLIAATAAFYLWRW